MNQSFDVIVMGAGFGGSLMATILQSSGLSVGLIDKTSHPRFTIGESSTPAADYLLGEIASTYGLYELEPLTQFGSWRETHPDLLCGCKRGFSYFWHGSENGFCATVDHQHELLVTANRSRSQADTQWYRPDVDPFFVEMAQKRGVTYFDNSEVTQIDHLTTHDWRLTFQQIECEYNWEAKFLIDASGPAGVLLNELNLPDWTDQLSTESHAVYSHWDKVHPIDDWLMDQKADTKNYPYPVKDSAIHHLFKDGWLWQIRFENNLQSVGFVSQGSPSNDSESADRFWNQILDQHPIIKEVIGTAQLSEIPGKLFQSGKLQRLWGTAAGEDWAALPFTVGFIDPLHSTGIAQTLHGVNRLAKTLLGQPSEGRTMALKSYSAKVLNEFLLIDRLVAGCYAGLNDFRLFTAFSMIYFAAATKFEQCWKGGAKTETGYLCAEDERFVDLTNRYSAKIIRLSDQPSITEEQVARFCKNLEIDLAPYNHVGLFRPDAPNMYRYTSVK
jgi:FADH2 O2-dependent halogenase